jgi:hypothetical protein
MPTLSREGVSPGGGFSRLPLVADLEDSKKTLAGRS